MLKKQEEGGWMVSRVWVEEITLEGIQSVFCKTSWEEEWSLYPWLMVQTIFSSWPQCFSWNKARLFVKVKEMLAGVVGSRKETDRRAWFGQGGRAPKGPRPGCHGEKVLKGQWDWAPKVPPAVLCSLVWEPSPPESSLLQTKQPQFLHRYSYILALSLSLDSLLWTGCLLASFLPELNVHPRWELTQVHLPFSGPHASINLVWGD